MDLQELFNSITKVILKVTFVLFWIIVIVSPMIILFSDIPNSKKLEEFGGALLLLGVGYLILRFARHSLRNK